MDTERKDGVDELAGTIEIVPDTHADEIKKLARLMFAQGGRRDDFFKSLPLVIIFDGGIDSIRFHEGSSFTIRSKDAGNKIFLEIRRKDNISVAKASLDVRERKMFHTEIGSLPEGPEMQIGVNTWLLFLRSAQKSGVAKTIGIQ